MQLSLNRRKMLICLCIKELSILILVDFAILNAEFELNPAIYS